MEDYCENLGEPAFVPCLLILKPVICNGDVFSRIFVMVLVLS
jgi:hypothetical protein